MHYKKGGTLNDFIKDHAKIIQMEKENGNKVISIKTELVSERRYKRNKAKLLKKQNKYLTTES